MKVPMKPATIVLELSEGKCVARLNMDGHEERALAVELEGITQSVPGILECLSEKDMRNMSLLVHSALYTYGHMLACVGVGCPHCDPSNSPKADKDA